MQRICDFGVTKIKCYYYLKLYNDINMQRICDFGVTKIRCYYYYHHPTAITISVNIIPCRYLQYNLIITDVAYNGQLKNCNHLIIITPQVENCETEDYRDTLQRGVEESVSLDDVEAWLEAHEDDPGFQILTEEEIVASVTEEAESSEGEEEEVGHTTQPTIKLSEVKAHLNFVVQYVEQSAN
jgi:hypothetical protein